MAQNTSLEGLRSMMITSIFGRRFGFDSTDYIVGPKDIRVQSGGWNSSGSTIVSTSVASNIEPYGFTVVGATGASATTAYTLAAPVPGVRKVLFNPTTGQVTILTTGAGAFLCSSGSITSTFGQIAMSPKGSAVELIGLTTNLWGVLNNSQISTGGTAVTFV